MPKSHVSADYLTGTYLNGLTDKGEWAGLVAALEASAADICVECGARLGGLLGSFSWGIAYGEGFCSRCGFPYRLYHRFPIDACDKYGKPRGDALLMAFIPLAEIPLSEPA